MFFLVVGLCLPFLIGFPSPHLSALLCAGAAGGLIAEVLRRNRWESNEMLATPVRAVALLLAGGGAVVLLKTWPEPVRHNAILMMFSGACLLWAYYRNRSTTPWFLMGPYLIVALGIVFLNSMGVVWANRYNGRRLAGERRRHSGYHGMGVDR